MYGFRTGTGAPVAIPSTDALARAQALLARAQPLRTSSFKLDVKLTQELGSLHRTVALHPTLGLQHAYVAVDDTSAVTDEPEGETRSRHCVHAQICPTAWKAHT